MNGASFSCRRLLGRAFRELLSNANPIGRACVCESSAVAIPESEIHWPFGRPAAPRSYHKMPTSPKEAAAPRRRRSRRGGSGSGGGLRSVAYLLQSCQLIISLLAHQPRLESVSCDGGSVCVSALKK